MIKEAIAKVVRGEDLREAEMMAVMTETMEGAGDTRPDRRLHHRASDQRRDG